MLAFGKADFNVNHKCPRTSFFFTNHILVSSSVISLPTSKCFFFHTFHANSLYQDNSIEQSLLDLKHSNLLLTYISYS